MKARNTKNFLIRNMPIELYKQLENKAKAHRRSLNQEAIFILTQGLSTTIMGLCKPKPFNWGVKVSSQFIYDAIDKGQE